MKLEVFLYEGAPRPEQIADLGEFLYLRGTSHHIRLRT
jgi:hypothetical protein